LSRPEASLSSSEGQEHRPCLTTVDGLGRPWPLSPTVGYGDVTAITNAGRLIGMCIMVIRLGFVAVVTGSLARYVIARETAEVQTASTNDIVTASAT
jgi:hypothetical protein